MPKARVVRRLGDLPWYCTLAPFVPGCASEIQGRVSEVLGAGKPGQLRRIPEWCSDGSIPFTDFMGVCDPYSKAELDTDTARDLARIRAVNPAAAAELEARIQRVEAVDIKNRPDLEAFWAAPSLSRVFGTSTVAAGRDALDTAKSGADWFLYGGLGLLGLALLLRR